MSCRGSSLQAFEVRHQQCCLADGSRHAPPGITIGPDGSVLANPDANGTSKPEYIPGVSDRTNAGDPCDTHKLDVCVPQKGAWYLPILVPIVTGMLSAGLYLMYRRRKESRKEAETAQL
ncbi:MAG TPA: hypothetical protein VLF41_03065 [Candidatus Nanoarchaeia archaeon]|nr:hypothetical protein [Candidatus Nanoarchaeia archaeon]